MRAQYRSKKIVQPLLPPVILHRAPLIDALKGSIEDPSSTAKLVLLCAPAGYGKTTLLVDFARHTSIPCCWYFLDSSDLDPSMFIEVLIASIRQRFPHFGKALDAELAYALAADPINATGLDQLEFCIDMLCTDIDNDIHERFALFLCNYQEVNKSEKVNALVNRLLGGLPQHCVLAIESRAIPVLEFVSLLSRRQLIGLGSDRLRFTTQDIHALTQLQHIAPLSEQEARSLVESFEGWIAGILLGTRLGNIQFLSSYSDTNSARGNTSFRVDRQNLLIYLVSEVFKREPEVYAFLKETSVLHQMTPALCNALFMITDADVRLHYIEQQGLFVTRTEEASPEIYTCHPILRELLYGELCRQDPAHVAALHRRAADLFHAMTDYEQAIVHALAAGANDLAARFIQESSSSMLQQGHLETLARWIDMLPATVLEHSPRLLLSRANIYLMRRETAHALPLIERAQSLFVDSTSATESQLDSDFLAEMLVTQSVVLFETGEYLQARQLCEQAIALIAADERELRAQAHQRLGMCISLLGDCTTGIAHMQQALQLWGHNTERLETARLHGFLANAYDQLGNYALAEHHRIRAIESCTRLRDVQGKVNNLIGMAITKRNRGALDEAVVMLNEALVLARDIHFESGEAYALVNLGEIYQDQDLFDKALMACEDALALARKLDDSYLSNHALCTLATTYLFVKDTQTPSLLIEQTDVKVNEILTYESALCELTHGTILLFRHCHRQAYDCLVAAEAFLKKAGLKRLSLRASIRLAACQLSLGQRTDAICSIERTVTQVLQSDCKHIALIELHRFPELYKAMQEMPHVANSLSQHPLQQQTEPSESSTKQVFVDVQVDTPKLRVLAFGEPTVLINATPITRWRMARSRELFFFLLDLSRPIGKEQIIDLLWPDADDSIDQTLRSTVYYLRRVMGESCIAYNAGLYAIDLASQYGKDIWYDVAVFQERYTEAKKALAVEDDSVAERALQDMITLYRGDYVQAFYSNWCNMRRDELRRIYMDVRRQLACIAWRREQYDESIIHWQHLLSIDDCLEEAHYGLIRCFARQGKRELALRQYLRCKEVLQKELSLAPGPAMQRLYQRLSGIS